MNINYRGESMNYQQNSLFPDAGYIKPTYRHTYKPCLTASENLKGVLDVDTVKGCFYGMNKYPNGGCYGECYANKMATAYGRDFSKSVSRIISNDTFHQTFKAIKNHPLSWYRVGVNGDPCHDWENTVHICEALEATGKAPVIITKHWVDMSDGHLARLKKINAVINTSVSGMDTDQEVKHRVAQINRVRMSGLKSICRVVTCDFLNTRWANDCNDKQAFLLSFPSVIDNPLRTSNSGLLVKSGHIKTTKPCGNIVGKSVVSLHDESVYLGECKYCPDQCGVNVYRAALKKTRRGSMPRKTMSMFEDKVEFECVESVIGSGYENDVAELAILDGVAYRAARKNMQIHSAIILKLNGVFSGFFTFQVNHHAQEFCLLQSAMSLDKKDKEIYSKMVNEIIKQNTYGYPMVMTVSTKHDLENPKVFEKIGFVTYLKLSGFAYMVYGTLDQVRMKRLAHATMTNAWTTTKSDWLKMKREWNEKIEAAGEKHSVPNPRFASRDGCWQGSNGYSNVVLATQTIENGEVVHKKGKSFNGNASVLDPVACEVILRFFMPTDGNKVYNPFGGGVQFGFIAASYGYDYVASEIRRNQCDVNNALCSDLPGSAIWVQSDSSIYTPADEYDLGFSCPPYYRVEKYIDYDGVIPDGELNSIKTYEQFRETLFEGYRQAISKLKDNRFFVIMTGDSRDKNGAYYGCEAEHELFLKNEGLHIYNKIVYLECEFTRLAHAKRTLDYRKFPKREQKIIVAYKGDMTKIKELFPPIGRL